MRFILIDRILALSPGRSIEAEKTMSPDEELFRDHFPGFPVVPGVLLTEMMAQAAGRCLDAEFKSRGRAMLVQIKSASFREWVRPGETAHIVVSIRANQDTFATASGYIEVAGKRVCAAELMFGFVPSNRFAPGHEDPVLVAWLRSQPETRRDSDLHRS